VQSAHLLFSGFPSLLQYYYIAVMRIFKAAKRNGAKQETQKKNKNKKKTKNKKQ